MENFSLCDSMVLYELTENEVLCPKCAYEWISVILEAGLAMHAEEVCFQH